MNNPYQERLERVGLTPLQIIQVSQIIVQAQREIIADLQKDFNN